jgi:hypothetical protein
MALEKSPRTSARTRKNIQQYPHLIMQTPSTVQIRTAIEVLKKVWRTSQPPRFQSGRRVGGITSSNP